MSLRCGLATTNIIECPDCGVRNRAGRVSRRRDPAMVLSWCATALLEHEKRLGKVMVCRDLWMLKAALKADSEIDRKEAVA